MEAEKTTPSQRNDYSTEASSRRVYLMRKFAAGLIVLALIHLFFAGQEYRSITLDVVCFVIAGLLWLMADRGNRKYQSKRTIETDDQGNAKKKVL